MNHSKDETRHAACLLLSACGFDQMAISPPVGTESKNKRLCPFSVATVEKAVSGCSVPLAAEECTFSGQHPSVI